MTKKRKTYSREFKLEVLLQIQETDLSIYQIAENLGLRRNQLYKWRKQLDLYGEAAFKGCGRNNQATIPTEKSEISLLKHQITQLKQENLILKQAAAYFAREMV